MFSRKLVALPLVVATAVTLAACGSSSKETTGNAAGTGTSTNAAVVKAGKTPAGAPIVVGAVCSCTGAQQAQTGLAAKVNTAWAASVNAAGGINGHPVKMITLDDGGNPATSLQDAKQLVEQDHIIAMVGEFSLADAAWASYIASKGIPVVGGISQESPFQSNPDFFPSGSQLLAQTVGTIALAKTAHKSHLGVLYCAESPICAQVVPLAQGAGALYGVKVSGEKVSSTAPSYAAPCLSLKGAGADAVFPAVAAPVVLRVVDGCAQQGYKPAVLSQTTTTTNAWLQDGNLEGALLAGAQANPYDTSTPAIQELRNALNSTTPGATSNSDFTADVVEPWAGGKLFEAAAKAAHIGPSSTPADVKKGLYALKNETLGGLTGPLNFTPGKPAFVPCYFGVQIKSGQFVSLNGNKPICFTAAQTAALFKALHLG